MNPVHHLIDRVFCFIPMISFSKNAVVPFRVTFIMWVCFFVQFNFNYDLSFLGIQPRHLTGLIGVITAPMIHGDLNHIMSNTLPMLLLGWSLFYFYSNVAHMVFLNCYLMTGLLVWVFGREFYHIGASGVIYGLAFFLMLFGLFRKDRRSLLISIVVVLIYGGLIYGLMPGNPQTSWESHVFGAIVGGSTAYVLRNYKKVD